MTHYTFLVEIGTEELPPKSLFALAKDFAIRLTNEFDIANINKEEVSWFATPRRLAVKINKLSNIESYKNIEKFNSYSNISNKLSNNLDYFYDINKDHQNDSFQMNKNQHLVHTPLINKYSIETLLYKIVNNAITKLTMPKVMRWGSKNIKFIRPVHTVTVLLNNNLIPGNILGVEINRVLNGHRFIGDKKIYLEHADQYPQILMEKGRVIADYNQRKNKIYHDIQIAAANIGGRVDINRNLLEEITSLVEWPIVLTARFEDKFLSMPITILACTLENKQKYFSVYDALGKMMPYFIFVSNIESKDPQQIIAGNEKVLYPRLADTEFFFKLDCKKRLEERLQSLNSVIFQQKLGTLLDKSYRIKSLSAWIASQIGADILLASRAGLISKCDLMTNMVFEFTDTQGIMGMHYARQDGEPEEVALAQKEQYQPRFSGDNLPTTLVSCSLAIADKIDNLSGIIGIGYNTKNQKDPFSLRRAAIGIIRIIIEKKLSIDLRNLIKEAVRLYNNKLTNKKVVDEVINFILNRLYPWYKEQGYNIYIIKAILASHPTCLLDIDIRMRALSSLNELSTINILITINKRITNILTKSKEVLYDNVQTSILKEVSEIDLANHLLILQKKLKPMFDNYSYKEILIELSQLNEPLSNFFNNIMIMTYNDEMRINRLTLLNEIHKLFIQIADFSLLI